MTEYISLPLAKEIAERYARLVVEAPKAEYLWAKADSGDWILLKADYIRFEDLNEWCWAYTATELFSVLPVGTTIRKRGSDGSWNFECLDWMALSYRCMPGKHPIKMEWCCKADTPVEALGKMWLRVLDERIRRRRGE